MSYAAHSGPAFPAGLEAAGFPTMTHFSGTPT